MTNINLRVAYSPYSKGSMQQNEPIPFRNRAYSHLDNPSHNSSQYETYNTSSIQDKVGGIKKKYEKIPINCKIRSSEQNFKTPHDYTKSVSTYEVCNESSAFSPYRNPCFTPTANKEKKTDTFEIDQARNISTRSYHQREQSYTGKNEIKSQLESNRMALNAMKSQLQTKLNDLTAKTKANSNSVMKSSSEINSAMFDEKNATSYEEIFNKYSKNVDNRPKFNNEPSENRYSKYNCNEINSSIKKEPLEETSTTNYLAKYTVNRTNPTEKQRHQLSIISQISNSNHSDHKENSYDFEDKGFKHRPALSGNQTHEGTFKSNTQSAFISRSYINDNRFESQNRFNNSSSYIDNKVERMREQQKANLEFTLQKLDNSSGLPSKRTENEEINFGNKYQLMQRNYERPESLSSNSHLQTTSTYKYENSLSKQPKSNIKNNDFGLTNHQRSMELDRSQIRQLKDKYNISSNNNQQSSCIYRDNKLEKSSKNAKGDSRDNKSISREIQKLDMKIKQIEQNKKDLNINFKPYDPSKSISRNSQHQKKSISNYDKDQIIPISNSPFATPSKSSNMDSSKQNIKHQIVIEKVRPIYSPAHTPSAKNHSGSFGIKYVLSNKDEQEATERSESDENFKNRRNNYVSKFSEEKNTETGIEDRKKKIQEEVEVNNNIKSLVKAFGEQATLDQNFRNHKIWFTGENQQKKWAQLKKQLQNIGISMIQSKMKQTFTLDQSQNNPFFSVSDSKCSIKTLAQSYQQAQKNWEQKIVHKFNRSSLEKEGFNHSKIDFDKKGCIEVEDLVRFLNIESGTFLRNRDVFIIFKRISKGSKIQFNELLNIVCE